MTDNNAYIEQMAAALATIASPPITSDDEAGTKDGQQEGALVETSAEAAVSKIAVADEPASTDQGSDDSASITVVVGETVIDAGEPDGSATDMHDHTPDPADMADPASIVIDDDLDVGAPASPAAIDPAPRPAAATDIFKGFPAAPHLPGEFQLPLCDLVIGNTSDGGMYDFDAGAAESLFHAVKVPEAIAPVVVAKAGDAWHVTDG